MTLAEFEKYAKEHNIFYCTKELGEQIKVETPPILEQIKAEIKKVLDAERNFTTESAKAQALALFWVLELFDKYAEQEPCEDCDYSEIMDWEQDAKTGKAKPIYWCERHKEPCDDAISRKAVIQTLNKMDRYTANELTLCDTDKKFPANEVFIVDDVYEEIAEQLPSVRPQEPKWIPVCERLPEEAYGCLVTVLDTDVKTQEEFENILPYFVGYDGETWNDADGEPIPFEVIAWMPLPKPYEPQESEDKE